MPSRLAQDLDRARTDWLAGDANAWARYAATVRALAAAPAVRPGRARAVRRATRPGRARA